MATISSARPPWQRRQVFKFFASLKLAVVLLAVLIIAAIAGKIWESSFDAKVARAYVYRAAWFNLWLILLGANLTVSALSRWPWRKHHVAFLVTHLGIITLLTGSLIGRIFGIEGTTTLFKGEPPSNRLLIDEHQLRIHDSDGVLKGYRAEFLHRPPTPKHPRDLGKLASGARLSVIDYAEAIDAKLNPRPLDSGGRTALHFTIKTAMMGQQLESWLLADDAQNLKREVEIAGTQFTVRIENYWADLRIQDGKPVSLSDSPNNPAVVVTIRGRGVPIATAAPNTHGNGQAVSTNGGPSTIPNIAPAMNEANAAENHLTLFVADDGAISYELDSRKLGHSSGPLELNKPLVTGWADWQLVVDRILPHAEQWMDFTPAKGDSANQSPDGVRVRVEENGETFEQWISAGWQVTVPTSPNPIGISYGWRSMPLPIALELLDFEVARNEGNDAPAGFKSTLRVSTAEGESAT